MFSRKAKYQLKHIFLIEDDTSISMLYQKKLELSGYRVSAAHNGLEAVHMLKEDKQMPDAILLDLMMPVMDGEEFLRKFRKSIDTQDTPVIVLTNVSRDEAPKTLWHYGISGYFVKANHTPTELIAIIEKIMSES